LFNLSLKKDNFNQRTMPATRSTTQRRRPHVNIYLTDDESAEIKTRNTTESEKGNAYMYMIHDKLRKDYDAIADDLKITESKCETIEDECDRQEKTIINLKGYVQNLNSINNLNANLIEKYAKFQKETAAAALASYNDVRYFINGAFSMMLSVIFLQVVCWYMDIISFNAAIGNVIGVSPIFAYYIFRIHIDYWRLSTAHKRVNVKNTPLYIIDQFYTYDIMNIKNEIMDVSSSIDFLSGALDNM
jgi:hypothetical protein